MPPRLYAARYDTTAGGSGDADLLELLEDPADIGMRCSLPFWGQRIETRIRAKSQIDAVDRYNNHQGQRLAILDHLLDRPVLEGRVYEVQKDGRDIVYICGAAYNAHRLKYYQQSDMPASGDTDAIIKDVMGKVPELGADQTNVDATGTAIGSWEPNAYGGDLPADIIPELLLMSDAAGAIWDYYVLSTPLDAGLELGPPIAYLDKRQNDTDTDWVIGEGDLAPGGMRLARHIWDLKRKVTVVYGRVTGKHDGAGNSASLIESTTNFADEGVSVGDTVQNTADGSRGRVIAISTTTNPGDTLVMELSGGTDDDWDFEDTYIVHLSEARQVASASTSTETDIFGSQVPEFVVSQRNMNVTQAGQFADMLIAQFEKAGRVQGFTLSTPWIRDRHNVRWPLWEVIKRGGGYITADIFPASSLFDLSLDGIQASRIVAADYNYRTNRLRLVPDTEDDRLDVILKRGRLIDGEQVRA